MPKPERPLRDCFATGFRDLSVVVCDDGSRTLRCDRRGITWHSESGALAESKLVFLENSGAVDMLSHPCQSPTRILENGLGTGLNFWLTASLAMKQNALLHYVAVEPSLLSQELIDQLEYDQIPDCQPAMNQFRPLESKSIEGIELQIQNAKIHDFDFGSNQGFFDAIYHDAFSPEAEPNMWSESLFENLRTILRPGGRLVTYCVKSEIQRRLRAAGFKVTRTRGPVGGKREVLIASNP